MAHNQSTKDKVRTLRSAGTSLKQIYALTGIPVSTIRTWILDIQLTKKQKEELFNRALKALQKGRIKAAKMQTEKRILREKTFLDKGKGKIAKLTSRELFIAGVALYWAEGFKNKHEHRLGFCNSDPYMMKFYIKWLEDVLGVKKQDITARLTLNISYRDRTKEIEEYWSILTGIPLNQFTKPFYQNTQWKKQYKDNKYYGVLRVHVQKSLDHLLTMRGWIEGLHDNLK